MRQLRLPPQSPRPRLPRRPAPPLSSPPPPSPSSNRLATASSEAATRTATSSKRQLRLPPQSLRPLPLRRPLHQSSSQLPPPPSRSNNRPATASSEAATRTAMSNRRQLRLPPQSLRQRLPRRPAPPLSSRLQPLRPSNNRQATASSEAATRTVTSHVS